MKKAGLGIIDNLSFIFAAGMALGMAKRERAVTVLSSVIAFFVMYALINVLLVINGQILADNSICVIPTLEMEIFGGIVVGTTVAYLHNHFFTELSFLNVYPVLKN